jgi:broad specificity phosphatase PhoE
MLIGSTYERALQTARIISQATGLTLVPNALVREIEYPSRVMGRPLINLDALIFVCYSVCFRNAPQRRYRDAENLSDMYARIKKTYTLIESLTEAHDAVVVVSHSVYIHLMVAYMCRNRALSVRELIAIYLNFRTFKNCEVIHVEYVGPTPKGACPWLLH